MTPEPNFLLHGADYNYEQWLKRKDILEEDLLLMKKSHMNVMTLNVFGWSLLEKEDGVYDFSFLDERIESLHREGIKVILATPSGARPAWLAEKYPEVLRTNSRREKELFGIRHNHCPSSPLYRRKVREMDERLSQRYGSHPAVVMWHISNELGGECHCPLCQENFRSWLKDKYGNLDNLNEAWNTAFWSHTYTSWSQIQSPSPIGEYLVHGQNLDWRRFLSDQYISFMKEEIDAVRKYSPSVPVTANLMYFFEGIDYVKLAKELDVVSWDNYPRWNAERDSFSVALDTAFFHDRIRSLKGEPFILMESSPSSTNWQNTACLKTPGMHEASALQAVAHGSDSVQYFQWRQSRGCSEMFHGAVLSHNGRSDTRVFSEVSKLGEDLEKLECVKGAETRNKVAIIYDTENAWAIEEIQGYKMNKKNYHETLVSSYAPFYRRGIGVDIVDQSADISSYSLVVAPMLYMVKAGFTDKVKAFIDDGGVFVTTYMSGIVDENDLAFLNGAPGPLEDILGLRVEETDSLPDGRTNRVEMDGRSYINRDISDIVISEGAEVLATYSSSFYKGIPALLKNGNAYYIAFRSDGSLEDDLFSRLSSELSLPSAPFKGEKGVVGVMRGKYMFVFNFSDKDSRFTPDYPMKDLLSGRSVEGEVELEVNGVMVLEME